MTGKSPYRPEFEAALRLFARVSEAMHARGLPRPVLVGGAAAEYWSGSALMTGDLDVTTPYQPELEQILREHGFVRPSGPGRLTRGWIHPDLGLSLEVVADFPLGGGVPRERLVLVEALGDKPFVIIPVEDLIADRMGQYASGTAPEMREQARLLLHLHSSADRAYLERRVREETAGDYGLEDTEN